MTPNTKDPEELRNAVRERYATIAEAGSQAASCCGPSASTCCGPDSESVLVDYGDLDAEVVEGANMGLGCGIPTRHADLRQGDVVLDLGSGGGLDAFLAATEVGTEGRVIGVDMTPEMIALARNNAGKGDHSNVEFRLGEIEHLPVGDDTVDVVLSNCVINLVPDKRSVFEEIGRVLRPGGRITISDIVYYGDVPEEILSSVEAYVGCIAGAMEKDAYLDLIRAAGFQDVRIDEEKRIEPFAREDYGALSVTVRGIWPGE